MTRPNIGLEWMAADAASKRSRRCAPIMEHIRNRLGPAAATLTADEWDFLDNLSRPGGRGVDEDRIERMARAKLHYDQLRERDVPTDDAKAALGREPFSLAGHEIANLLNGRASPAVKSRIRELCQYP